MKQTSTRRHYRVGQKEHYNDIINNSPICLSQNPKNIMILMGVIYLLSNIISFMLGRICNEGRRY